MRVTENIIKYFGAAKAAQRTDAPPEYSDAFVSEPEENPDADAQLYCLNTLSPEDIAETKPKAPVSAAEKALEAARRVVYVASIAVLAVCLVLLAENIYGKVEGGRIYGEMSADFGAGDFLSQDEEIAGGPLAVAAARGSAPSTPVPDLAAALEAGGAPSGGYDVPTDTYNAALEKMKAKLNQYRQSNPDVYGYIYVEGTSIDYVLVQGDDNDFYLTHDVGGNSLVVGSIFVDYRNNSDIMRNFNTVTYGHNVTTGLMYHDVTKFADPEVFNNTLIWIYTFDGMYAYKPFAYYKTRYDYNYFRTSFATPAEFVEFAREMRDNSEIPCDVDFTETDRMITLSTCTNDLQTMRYALQAKLVQVIE